MQETPAPEPAVPLSPVIRVWLNRGEGRIGECNQPVTFEGERLLHRAWARLANWSRTAPDNGGYHKCDFRVTWANGQEYSGRYDLERDSHCDLLEQVAHYCRHIVAHKDDPRYQAIYRPESVEAAERVLATCDLEFSHGR